MGRPQRSFAEGIYHFGSHGSDTRHLFLNSDDRLSFLARLTLVGERFGLGLVAYALLGNHYHAIAATPGDCLSRALQQVHSWYARWHNRRHERFAHLFRAHCFAREITSDEDLLGTCHYVAHNPVEAGLSDDPFAWPWSSAAASAGIAAPTIPLDPGPLQAAFGGGDDWQRRYRAFIGG